MTLIVGGGHVASTEPEIVVVHRDGAQVIQVCPFCGVLMKEVISWEA